MKPTWVVALTLLALAATARTRFGQVRNVGGPDCSGFVSAAWNVSTTSGAYSGRSTLGYAPFDTSVSHVLGSIRDLLPGDALNNRDHIMLFGGWTGPDTFFVYQESTCEPSVGITVPHRKEFWAVRRRLLRRNGMRAGLRVGRSGCSGGVR